ncbi:N-acyl homoserine lactonase family protein [Geoglobus acetivorans]|uniref:Beta-lactamase domain protein n=1 Tax=Geoglobus acetivorans TaxID=565033 RepID=A0A0A7GHY5_GEOAI|nr:Beta-lactamase domain protein [Geoglobus acetivorans]
MYVIKPLKQAEIMAPLGVIQMLGDMTKFINGPVYVWYLDGERKILIDAGIEEPVNGMVHGFPVSGGGEKGLREALSQVNVTPEEIDVLILTHLHFDHVANAQLFHNARIYVQKREWESAFNPPLHYRLTYDQKLFQPLEDMDLCLVDGDKRIADGIELVSLPGHTKGLQGVAVETEEGTYLVAGDHFYTYLNLNPPKEAVEIDDATGGKIQVGPVPLPFAPVGLHVDLSEWYDSCYKALSVTRRANILPGHEPSLAGMSFP